MKVDYKALEQKGKSKVKIKFSFENNYAGDIIQT
jgi:hypothetical protein